MKYDNRITPNTSVNPDLTGAEYQPVTNPSITFGMSTKGSNGFGMTGADWLSAGLGLVNAGANLASTLITNKSNEANVNSTNAANQAISQKNYDAVMATNAMNKELTEKTWERDDSQLQRARRDAENAGFSPMAALSNNLTNSSPLQMQAPQYTNQNQSFQGIAPQIDLSNIGNVFSQAGLKNQQTEQLALANQFTKETLNVQKLKTATELAKLLSDLDSQNLSNAEKASVLLASGFKSSDLKKLLGDKPISDVPKNTSAQEQTNLIKAQTAAANAAATLSSAQATTQSKMDLLYDAQKSLVEAQKDMAEQDKKYWYDNIYTIEIPVLEKDNGGNWNVKWKKLSGNRKWILDQSSQKIEALKAFDYAYKMDMSDWDKLGKILDIF